MIYSGHHNLTELEILMYKFMSNVSLFMATHGSLTKAGKVRGQTPKIEGRKIVGTNSSLRNKRNFMKRFVLGRVPGQNKPGQKRKKR